MGFRMAGGQVGRWIWGKVGSSGVSVPKRWGWRAVGSAVRE